MPLKKINSFIERRMQSLPEEQKNIVLVWISQVEKIVQDEALISEQKIRDIENLSISEPVVAVLEGFFESFTEFIPANARSWLKTGIGGAALFANVTVWKRTIIGVMAFKKFLPHFLLSNQGQKALDILKLSLTSKASSDF